MPAKPEFPLRIFYDGSCCVCSGEMLLYMKRDHGGRLVFIDISDPDFKPDRYGISIDDFMYQMHAIDRAGRLYRGVDAFWAIWQAFPASPWYGLLGTLVTMPGINLFARMAYRTFARTRKYLPKKHGAACKIGSRPQQ
jgi:predicted DCC family thiol-disulfide oxidoreductase YuxK